MQNYLSLMSVLVTIRLFDSFFKNLGNFAFAEKLTNFYKYLAYAAI